MNNNFFKYLSVFLLGMILGYLIKGINLAPQTTAEITSDGSVKVMGQEDAPVTIVEYSDFQCPLCKKYYEETFATIKDQYVKTGKVKYVFKHFPLNIHPQAPAAALATECALEQNKFWEMHDTLFVGQSSWSGKGDHLNTFKTMAKNLGLNENQFNACLDSQKYKGNVEQDYQEGLNRSIRGTPSFYIGDQVLIGAQDTSKFIEMLDSALGATPETQASPQETPATAE